MATDMGHGIIAPKNGSNIGTGASELRALGASVAAALDLFDSLKLSVEDAEKYGIEGQPGPPGNRGPRGLPGPNAVPADEAVAAYVSDPEGSTATQQAADARYLRKGTLSLSVDQYGAIGDGQTDDTTAFQTALDAAVSFGAKVVYLPMGEYMVGNVTIPDNTTVASDGQTTIKAKPGSSSAILELTGDQSSISNVKFQGNASTQHGERQSLITVSGDGTHLDNIYFEDAYDRCVTLTPDSTHTTISNLTLARNGVIGNCNGLHIQGSYVSIENVHIYEHGNGHAFRIGNTPEKPPKYVTISNSVVERSEHNAFTLEDSASHVTIANCIAVDVPQAVKGATTANNITVVGCHFEDISLDTTFQLNHVRNTTVSATTIKNSGGGIYVGANSVVSGCRLENVSGAFAIRGRTGTVIQGCTVQNSDVTDQGIYCDAGIISDCILQNVTTTALRIQNGGKIQGCYVKDCGSSGTAHLIWATNQSGPGSSITNNTIVSSPEHESATHSGIYLQGDSAIIESNAIVGQMPVGVRVANGYDNYIVSGNILSSASTPVVEGDGENRLVTNNI